MWFVRLCQLLTGQPMLAAVLVLLSSTPCSPGTARGVKPMQMWVPLGCSVRSRRPPERPGPAWYSTAPGGGGRRRRHGLCVYGRGSVARRHWPAPKPQLVAPGPLQYRRGGIRTSSATPGPPTARTNAPPSSPHPATTRSLRGRWTARCFSDTACLGFQAALVRPRNSCSTSLGVRYPRAE